MSCRLMFPFLFASAGSWSVGVGADTSAGTDGLLRSFVDGNNQFAVSLYREVGDAKTNLILSPYCVRTAFSILYAGARGQTREQMASALVLPPRGTTIHSCNSILANLLAERNPHQKFTLLTGNRLFARHDVTLDHRLANLLRDRYAGYLQRVHFGKPIEACMTVNRWIKRQTQGRIVQVLSPHMVDARRTALVLVSVIHFAAPWQAQFSEDHTCPAPFRRTDGTTVQVPFMSRAFWYRYARLERLELIAVPLDIGGRFNLVIALPRNAGGLEALHKGLEAKDLRSWLAHLDNVGSTCVRLYLPRFELAGSLDLIGPLSHMGMSKAFSPQDADFSSLLTSPPNIHLSLAVHDTWLQVEERGIETSAVTTLGGLGGEPRDTSGIPVFRADHPFLFVIRDRRTKCILFIGHTADPTPDSGR